MAMLKLYQRDAGRVRRYHEAWRAGREIVEHWGEIGTPGEVNRHPLAKGVSEADQLQAVLRSPREAGYEPLAVDDHRRLLVEYSVPGKGTAQHLAKRHALEQRLNEILGWTGLGHCDGGSIGSGTMEACCFVVDFDMAKDVIAGALRETPFSDFTRIYDEDGA